MKKRNPLRDPLPGDKFRIKCGQIVVVRHLGEGETRDLKLFRRAMRGAVVLFKAEIR